MHRTALAVTGLTVVALGGTGVAVAHAATSSTPPTAPAAPTARAHKRAPLHADGVRRGGKGTFVTYGTQRGTVTAASPTSLTVRSVDGFVRTYVLGPTTVVKLDKAAAAAGDLAAGEKVGLVAVQTGDTWTLRRVNAHH